MIGRRSVRFATLATTGLTVLVSAGAQSPRRTVQAIDAVPPGHAFYFTRAAYNDYRGRGRGAWATDYPKADIQFLIGLKRLTNIDAFDREHAIRLDDPALRSHPLLYAVEVGWMNLTQPEIDGLRAYLLAGGLLVVDDFWGTREWANFEFQISRVLPEFPVVELPMDHPVLRSFYAIEEIVQVPNVWQGRRGGPTWERDGYEPHLRGIHDAEGRLLVLISFNSDLGDAWEWAEDPFYPLPYSNFAYRLGVNMVVYGMSH